MKGKGVGIGERVNTLDLILYVGATGEFQQEGVTHSSLSVRLLWRQCLEGSLLNQRRLVPLRDDVSLRYM